MLSRGKVRKDCLRCPYHGWEFDGRGECARIPSLLPEQRIPKGSAIRSFATIESGGIVWFCFSDRPLFEAPPAWHFLEDRHFFTATIDIRANYLRVMENLVDNPHAGFLHEGLLRVPPTTPVTARIRRTAGGVHIETSGERARESILARMFGKKDQVFEHTEAYEHPYVIRTLFRRDGSRISSQFLCVPVDEHNTRWYVRGSLFHSLTSAIARVAMPVFKRIVLRILHQDRDVLEEVEALHEAGAAGPRVSTGADGPSILVVRAASEFAEQGAPAGAIVKEARTTYRL